MAVIWPTFVSGFVSYVSSNNAQSEDATAKKIAQLYHASVQTAMPILVPGATPIGLTPGPIESGFKAAFRAAKSAGEAKPTPATWTPAAAGIVAYWAGKTFTPVPPPTWISGTNNILFPGVPPPLASQIHTAFQAMAAPAVASLLVAGFTTHLATISGLFTGPNATSLGAPIPFPWVGIA